MRPGGGYGYSRVGRYGGHADTAGMRMQQERGYGGHADTRGMRTGSLG